MRKSIDTLDKELNLTGFRYRDNEDGTFEVCYDHNQDTWFDSDPYHTAAARDDEEYWYIDNRYGLGEGIYPKSDYTLLEAIYDQCGDWSEKEDVE